MHTNFKFYCISLLHTKLQILLYIFTVYVQSANSNLIFFWGKTPPLYWFWCPIGNAPPPRYTPFFSSNFIAQNWPSWLTIFQVLVLASTIPTTFFFSTFSSYQLLNFFINIHSSSLHLIVLVWSLFLTLAHNIHNNFFTIVYFKNFGFSYHS